MPINAPIHRLTVDDHYAMMEAGVLREGERIELLNGQLVDMMSIGSLHGGSTNRLTRVFERLSRERWITSV